MKPIFLLLIASACLTACQSKNNKQAGEVQPPKTLETFADSLVRLDKFALESLETAADYYRRLVPADSLLANSAAVMFLRHVASVVDTTNQRLFQDTTDYFDLVYNKSPNAPAKQKAFQQKLASHHVRLQADGEGSVYAVPDHNWITNTLQPKTSSSVDAYLNLLSREESEPTLLDAGLAIEPAVLADRLISSEKLIGKRMPKTFADDLARRHRFYLGTLLFGSDNSPALEYNDPAITEQYKSGYDYLLSKYPSSEAARLVKEWQDIIRAKDNRKMEEWRSRYHPYYE